MGRVAAQQKESTYSFLGDVEEDGDDELRTTVQSQIRITATLSTFGQKDSDQTTAVPLHCQDTQRVSAERFIRPSIELTEESHLPPEVTPTLHKGEEAATIAKGKVKLAVSGLQPARGQLCFLFQGWLSMKVKR
jgi:hypothetical protein